MLFFQHNLILIPDSSQTLIYFQTYCLGCELSWPLFFSPFLSAACLLHGLVLASKCALLELPLGRCLGEKECWNNISRIRVEDFCKLHGTSLRGVRWPSRGMQVPASVTWDLEAICPLTYANGGLYSRMSVYLHRVWHMLLWWPMFMLSVHMFCLLPEEMYFPGDPRGSCVFLGLPGLIGLSLLLFRSLVAPHLQIWS